MNNKINKMSAISIIVSVIIVHILSNLPQYLIHSNYSSSAINTIFVTILALIIGFIIIKLFKKFPNDDILDISEFVAGSFFKKTIGIIFIISLITISALLIRNFSENLANIYFKNTHFSGIIIFFLLASCILNRFGFKAIVRCNLIILPLVLISLIIIFFSTASYGSFQRFLPILGKGFNETFIFGSTNIFSFGGLFLIYFIAPLVEKKEELKSITSSSIIISGIYLLLSVASLIMLIPNIAELESTLSIYLVAREVEFGSFFQRLDAIFILIWMLSVFSYCSIILYFIINIFKKIFNLKHSKPMIYAFSLIILFVSLIPSNLTMLNTIFDIFYKYISLLLPFGLNIAILIIANIKKGGVKLNE